MLVVKLVIGIVLLAISIEAYIQLKQASSDILDIAANWQIGID
jgi:hypothetical protein